MNWFHRQVCRSGRWRRRVEGELLPWALQGVELGDDVLEVGPGPGVTTDLLRAPARRLTALEVDAVAAEALQKRLNDSGVRVVHGDGSAMPFADGSFSSVVLRPGGVFAGFDGVGSVLFRLVHLGDTYTPVNPDGFGRRLEAAGFADVAVERGRARFRFRATRT
jgi:hypothetical protein